MAYNITIGAKFRPFSYDEMIKPVQSITQAHYATEDALYEMRNQASLYDTLAGQSPDSVSRRMYNEFSSKLNAAIDDLVENGYSINTRRAFSQARNSFADNIIPLQDARTRRAAAIEAQLKGNASGNMRYTKDAFSTTIDDFIGKDFNYGSVNLDKVYQEATAFAGAWSKRFSSTAEGIAFGGDYLKLVKTVGLDNNALREGVKAIIASGKYPSLNEGLNAILTSTGASQLTGAALDEAMSSALAGISTGISYDQQIQLQDNWRAKEMFKHQLASNPDSGLPETGEIENFIETNGTVQKNFDLYFRTFDNGRVHLRTPEEYKKMFGGIDIYHTNKDGTKRLKTVEEFNTLSNAKYRELVKTDPTAQKYNTVNSVYGATSKRYQNFLDTLQETGIDISKPIYTRNNLMINTNVAEHLTKASNHDIQDKAHSSRRYIGLSSSEKKVLLDRMTAGNPNNMKEVAKIDYKTSSIKTNDNKYTPNKDDEVISYNTLNNGEVFVTIAIKGDRKNVKRVKVPREYLSGIEQRDRRNAYAQYEYSDNPSDALYAGSEVYKVDKRISTPMSKE